MFVWNIRTTCAYECLYVNMVWRGARLVSYEHDDNVRLGVVAQLLQPALHILECGSLGDVVDKQRTHLGKGIYTYIYIYT